MVDIEARLIYLKSRSCKIYSRLLVQFTCHISSCYFVLHSINQLLHSHSWLLSLNIISTFLAYCRIHVMIMILLIGVHWLLYAILITAISWCTDILIFFLRNKFRASNSSDTERLGIVFPHWEDCWITMLKPFVTDFCQLVISLSFFVSFSIWFIIRLTFWPSFSLPVIQLRLWFTFLFLFVINTYLLHLFLWF